MLCSVNDNKCLSENSLEKEGQLFFHYGMEMFILIAFLIMKRERKLDCMHTNIYIDALVCVYMCVCVHICTHIFFKIYIHTFNTQHIFFKICIYFKTHRDRETQYTHKDSKVKDW